MFQWTNIVMCIERIKATWCHKHKKYIFSHLFVQFYTIELLCLYLCLWTLQILPVSVNEHIFTPCLFSFFQILTMSLKDRLLVMSLGAVLVASQSEIKGKQRYSDKALKKTLLLATFLPCFKVWMCVCSKLLRKLINGPYHFEQEIDMDISSLNKNDMVKAI